MHTEQQQDLIEEHKKSLVKKWSEFTNDQIAQEMSELYDTELLDFINERLLMDEGVYEYFILNDNKHYRNAMYSLLEYIDYPDKTMSELAIKQAQ